MQTQFRALNVVCRFITGWIIGGKKSLWLTDPLADRSKEIPETTGIEFCTSLHDTVFKVAQVILCFTDSIPVLYDVHFQWRKRKERHSIIQVQFLLGHLFKNRFYLMTMIKN